MCGKQGRGQGKGKIKIVDEAGTSGDPKQAQRRLETGRQGFPLERGAAPRGNRVWNKKKRAQWVVRCGVVVAGSWYMVPNF